MWLLLASLLVFAPLMRSGQTAMAQLLMELLAIGLLAAAFWGQGQSPIRHTERWVLVLLFVYPVAYLLPWPAGWAAWLPGRELYAATATLLSADLSASTATGLGRLSLTPFTTEAAWLLLLVPLAVYVGTRTLDPRRQQQLLLVLLGVAAFQATLGLMQYGAGSGALYLGMEHAHGSAVGTYTNRNHLAGLIEMLLPVTLALLLFSVGRRSAHERHRWRRRLAFLGSLRGHAALGYGVLALLLLIGVVFTRSRAGIALTMLGILLATFAFARRLGGTNVYGMTGTLVTVALGIGLVIGLGPVLDRFTLSGAIEDARWSIYTETLAGIGRFFPLGSGPGSYPEVFPAFQPLALGRWLINHAHNDYLEWLFEGGALAAGLILLVFALILRQWVRVWTPGAWSRMRFLQVGAGIGLTLMLLHGFVDFNLHIPANMVYFAFLAGIFFTDPPPEEAAIKSRRRRRTPELGAEPDASTAPVQDLAKPPPDQIRNPFLD